MRTTLRTSAAATWCRRSMMALATAVLATALATPAVAAELTPEAVKAWNRYEQLTEARIERELRLPSGFLLIDLQDASRARDDRRDVLGGNIVTASMTTTDAQGREIEIPSAMLHHWRGAVFIPRLTLDELLDELQHPGRTAGRAHRQEDMLESRVLARDRDQLRLFLKLQRKKIVTVTYNTEHDVRYRRLGREVAASRSVATKIAELEDANMPNEREKPQGHDRGFMWRLNSYWRYQEVAGGVIVECESLTLSRDIPAALRFIARPIIDSVARESMARTLESLRSRFAAGTGSFTLSRGGRESP